MRLLRKTLLGKVPDSRVMKEEVVEYPGKYPRAKGSSI